MKRWRMQSRRAFFPRSLAAPTARRQSQRRRKSRSTWQCCRSQRVHRLSAAKSARTPAWPCRIYGRYCTMTLRPNSSRRFLPRSTPMRISSSGRHERVHPTRAAPRPFHPPSSAPTEPLPARRDEVGRSADIGGFLSSCSRAACPVGRRRRAADRSIGLAAIGLAALAAPRGHWSAAVQAVDAYRAAAVDADKRRSMANVSIFASAASGRFSRVPHRTAAVCPFAQSDFAQYSKSRRSKALDRDRRTAWGRRSTKSTWTRMACTV
jgi:hypothetical protein